MKFLKREEKKLSNNLLNTVTEYVKGDFAWTLRRSVYRIYVVCAEH